jgi:hypothetical protein
MKIEVKQQVKQNTEKGNVAKQNSAEQIAGAASTAVNSKGKNLAAAVEAANKVTTPVAANLEAPKQSKKTLFANAVVTPNAKTSKRAATEE